jgi:DNA-binding transcriptional LysR family regulator
VVDLRKFRYFVTVVDEGQLTRAARRLHVAQPALSQSIAALERELQVELLIRHSRGVTPTNAGTAFYKRARESIAAAERATMEARALAPDARGRVVIASLPGLLSGAAGLLGSLARARPDIDVRTREVDFATQLSLLRAGEVDAEVLLPPPNPAEASDLEIVVIGSMALAANLSEAHPLAARAELSSADIIDEPFTGRDPRIPDHWADTYWLTAQRGGRPRVIDERPVTPDEVWYLVASGRCVTVGPALFAPYVEAMGGVAVRPLSDVPPAVLAVAARCDDRRDAVRALLEAARAQGGAGVD